MIAQERNQYLHQSLNVIIRSYLMMTSVPMWESHGFEKTHTQQNLGERNNLVLTFHFYSLYLCAFLCLTTFAKNILFFKHCVKNFWSQSQQQFSAFGLVSWTSAHSNMPSSMMYWFHEGPRLWDVAMIGCCPIKVLHACVTVTGNYIVN